MGSQADILFGRLAQERGWVDPQALRQIYAQLGPGESLPQALVARGLIAEHHARQLWAEVQQSGLGPVPAPTLAPPVEGATVQLGPPGSQAGTLAPPGGPPTSAAPSWGPGAPGGSSPTVGAPPGYDGGFLPGPGGLPAEGEVVGERFRVGAVLGKGGMGAVYRAHDLSNDAEVALKVMLPGADPDGSAMLRFQREAEAVVKVDAHAGIVRVRDFGQHRGMPYAAMDLVVGRDLHEIVKEQGGLPIDEALRLTEEVSRAIAHCHAKGVLHRDLKPANVLLRQEDGQPFVTDFGLALDEQLERLTRTGQVMGTPAYMPPEQAEGDKEAMDERVDVYSLGAILYELVSGEAPFQGDQVMILKQVFMDEPQPLVERRGECPPDVDLICQKAMAKDKELRYASAAELAEDIARFRQGDPITARPPTRAEREAWLRKRGDRGAIARFHARWAVPLLAVLALVVGVAFAARLLDSEAKAREELALLLEEPLAKVLAPSVLAERDPKPYTTLLTKLLKDVATLRGQEGEESAGGLESLRAELARDPDAAEALERPGAGLFADEDLAKLHGLARRLAFLDGQALGGEALASDPCAALWVALRGLRFGQREEPSAAELREHGAALEALSQEGELALLAKRLSGALRAARARLERAERAGWQAVTSGRGGGAWNDAQALEEVDTLLAERELQGCFEGVKVALQRACKRAEASAQLPKLEGEKGVEAFDLLVAERLLKEPSVEVAPLRKAATRLFLAQVPGLFEAFQRRDPEPVRRMAARPRLLGLVVPDPDAELFQTYALALIGAYQEQDVPADALIQIIRFGINVVSKQNRQAPKDLYARVHRFLEQDAQGNAYWQWGDAFFVEARLFRQVREKARDADSHARDKAVARYLAQPEHRGVEGLARHELASAYDTKLHVEFKREHDLAYWTKLARLFARALAPEVAFDLEAYGIEPLQPAEHPKLPVSAAWRSEVLYWLIEATRELVHDRLSVLRWDLAQATEQGLAQTQAELKEKIRELGALAKRQRASVERVLPTLASFRSAKNRVVVLQWLAGDYLEWRPWLKDSAPAEQRARELFAEAYPFALEQLEKLKQLEFGAKVSFGQLDRLNTQDTWIRALRKVVTEWAKLQPREQAPAVLAELWRVEGRVRAAIKASDPRLLTTVAMIAVSLQQHADARRAIEGVRQAFVDVERDDERNKGELGYLDEALCYEAMIELEEGNLARVRELYQETKERVPAFLIGKNWLPVLNRLKEEEAQSSQGK